MLPSTFYLLLLLNLTPCSPMHIENASASIEPDMARGNWNNFRRCPPSLKLRRDKQDSLRHTCGAPQGKLTTDLRSLGPSPQKARRTSPFAKAKGDKLTTVTRIPKCAPTSGYLCADRIHFMGFSNIHIRGDRNLRKWEEHRDLFDPRNMLLKLHRVPQKQ